MLMSNEASTAFFSRSVYSSPVIYRVSYLLHDETVVSPKSSAAGYIGSTSMAVIDAGYTPAMGPVHPWFLNHGYGQ